MAKETSRATECSDCGAVRPESQAGLGPSSCPRCGSTARTVRIGLASEINIAGSIGVVLTPRSVEPEWKQHWTRILVALGRLEEPNMTPLSGNEIMSAGSRVGDFFVLTYHLKDVLIAEGVVGRDAVEDRVFADPRLALLADLANLNKHRLLRRRPRSGFVPSVGEPSGSQRGDGVEGWQLVLRIEHGTRSLDALEVARSSVDAWREALESWGVTDA